MNAPQAAFRAPRIPFDLRCVILSAAGFLVLQIADAALGLAFQTTSPFAQLVHLIGRQLGSIGFIGEGFRLSMAPVWGWRLHEMTLLQSLVTAVVFLVVWSFFGGAILRAIGLRLTRDEPLSLRECLVYGAKRLPDFLAAPVLVAAFAMIFLLLNMAAGFVMSLPFLGSSLLALILFPLVLLSSLLIVLSIIGGMIGLPLMWAGIAVEENGSLDGLSRAYSYLFARPLQAFFTYLLVFVLMGVILLVGSHVDGTVKTSLKAGIVRHKLDDLIEKDPVPVEVLENAHRNMERRLQEQQGITNIRNLRGAGWEDWIGFLWMWLCLNLVLVGFKGYAVYVFLGGTASLYLQLRQEVDGTGPEEIHGLEPETVPADTHPRWVEGEAPAEPAPTGDGEADATDAPEPDTGAGDDEPPPETEGNA